MASHRRDHLSYKRKLSLPISGVTPFYRTQKGIAVLGDGLNLIRKIRSNSVDLIFTSPPFALLRKKKYGNQPADGYIPWFASFATEFKRVLCDNGSFVLHLGGSWNKGLPTKSLYEYELVLTLCRHFGFHLAQEFVWHNTAKMPGPAAWVTVRRIRVKDSVDHIWWLSKSPFPEADNRRILREYSEAMLKLFEVGYNSGRRPYGGTVSSNSFSVRHNGAIRPNFLTAIEFPNTESNTQYLRMCRDKRVQPHPARLPISIPKLFIEFLTTKGECVLDPFAGSNTTGEAAEGLDRKWIAFEIVEDYLEGSRFRFKGTLEKPRGVPRKSI